MAAQKMLVNEFPWDPRYAVSGLDDVLTPALVIYPEIIASNIERTCIYWAATPIGGASTSKHPSWPTPCDFLSSEAFLISSARQLWNSLSPASAVPEIFFWPIRRWAPMRAACGKLHNEFPDVRISVLIENEEQLRQWQGSRVGIFLDLNSGMNRTGIDEGHLEDVVTLARAIGNAGLEFRGLHFYDGQYGASEEPERTKAVHAGYDRLMKIVAALERSGIKVPELITAGTPTFPSALSYQGFRKANFIHRVSPGTVVYCDATTMAQLPKEYGYQPAVLVLTRVVSHPRPGIVTCDAGHKAVSADAGVPTCVVIGHPELTPLSPSEEHLPIAVNEGAAGPRVGEALYLLPRHVCPTVNNFNDALVVRHGAIESVEKVSARGREAPLLPAATLTQAVQTAK